MAAHFHHTPDNYDPPGWLGNDDEIPLAEVHAYRLEEGPSDGVQIVDLYAGDYCATICPTRGMGVLNLKRIHREEGEPIPTVRQFGQQRYDFAAAWSSPVEGPVHPSLVDLRSRGGLGWLDGFDELVARCGLTFNGPPGHDPEGPPLEQEITLHGRVANIPASGLWVERAGQSLRLHGYLNEATLFGQRLMMRSEITLSPRGKLTILDRVTNSSSKPAELQLLYHINIAMEWFRESPKLKVPKGNVQPRDETAAAGLDHWTRIDPPTSGYAEQVFFVTPEATGKRATVELRSEDAEYGIRVHQKLDTLPYLSLWKCFQDQRDGNVLGIEPGTGFPNFKAEEREAGRVVTLAPGEERVHEVAIELFEDA